MTASRPHERGTVGALVAELIAERFGAGPERDVDTAVAELARERFSPQQAKESQRWRNRRR
jgi:hypothetical protein